MTSPAQPSNASPSHLKHRALLQAGTALCGVAALALAGGARAAILPTQLSANLATPGAGSVNTKVLTNGVVTPATANYVSTGPAATVTLVAPRTLIDWTTFQVGAGSTLNFTFTNAPSDIVLNRVMGGSPGTNTIAVDAGGAVNGTFNGAVAGNIWFLAADGVFIHGTVTASGVLATNNTTVADLNLLSDAAATLKGELAAGASLIDLSGITAASGATIDASGNIFLSGPETVTGDVMLESTGALAINAKIVAEGAVPVTLAYTSDSPTNFSLGAGASLTFANADGTPATSSAGGSLTINGQPFTLLYKLADPGSTGPDTGLDDVAGIDNNVNARGPSGFYALATDLTGTGTAANPQFTSALVGQGSTAFTGVFEGLGHTISGLTINDPVSGTPTAGPENVGLFGYIGGTVRDLGLVGGSVTGANQAYVGDLAGGDVGTVIQDYASGAVSNGLDGPVGGLVGATGSTGTIARSYATGPVTGAGATVQDGNNAAGGLVGNNSGFVNQSYAMGAVTGGPNMDVGGLVGVNAGSIAQTYATGAVSGSGAVITGGLVGLNVGPSPGGVISSGAFDIQTTGQFFGIGQDQNNQAGNVAALTTGQLQTTGLPSGFDPTVWGGGSGGLYPFLTSFFPNGVQAVSDFGFAGFNRASLASGPAGAVTIGVIAGGTKIGAATTGADSYFYIAVPAGTLTDGETLLSYTASGAPGSAHLSTATSAATQSDVSVYAGAVIVPTAALTLSTAPTLAQAQAQALAAAGSNGDAQASINSTTGLGLQATGASFTIDQPVTTANGFGVQTAMGAPLIVAAPIVLNTGGELALYSRGALAIDAPITVDGVGGAFLTYDSRSPTNLSFGNGGSLTYNNADGSPATSSQGGVLAINGQLFNLLYNLAQAGSSGPDSGIDDIAGIDNNMAAGGDNGLYALATNLTGTGTAANPQFTSALAGQGFNSFSGVFEGLGHTITGLTMNDPVSGTPTGGFENVGLFGSNSGMVRDVGLIGGSVTGANLAKVGDLVGRHLGAIVQAYATGAVSGGQDGAVGGLVGATGVGDSPSTITRSYATGPVSGAGASVGPAAAGGLVGQNLGVINQSYATGAVSDGPSADVGGLVGVNSGSITETYATGAVSGAGAVITGGLVGINVGPGPTGGAGGTIASGAFDLLTTGQAFAIGQDQNNQSGNIAALTTSQLQGNGLPGGFDPTVWGGGSGGLYPFLTSFFPNGVQAVSDFAFAGFSRTPLASGPAGAVTIGLIAGGTQIGEATTGANGYFYIAAPAGTFTDGETLLAYTVAGAPGSAHVSTATSAGIQSDSKIFGGVVVVPTAALTLSTAPTLAQAQAQALAAAGANGDAQVSINGATGLGLEATGASFTIDQPVTTANAFGVQTAMGAPLTVAAPIVLNSGGELALSSRGTLAIDAPITVNGAGGAFLDYDPASPTNFGFGNGASLTYNTAAGSPATASQGGVLRINGQVYTLLYNLAQPGSTGPDTGLDDIAGIDANFAAGGDIGVYALATNLTGTGTATSPQFIRALAGSGGFNGELEGLGHTITNLTINDPNSGSASSYETVGLLGYIGNGLVRDLGIVGGSVVGGQNYTNVGELAGGVYGRQTLIIQSYATGSVSSGQNASIGGLVGYLAGQMISDYDTGPVAGGGSGGVGGLVGGLSQGSITGSYATGAVSGAGNDSVGGLAGYNRGGVISGSLAAGPVNDAAAGSVGGLVGYNYASSTIDDTHANGPVSGGSGAIVGGLVGDNQGFIGVAYATGAVNAGDNSSAGGLVGGNLSGGAVNLAYATGAVTTGASSNVGGLVGDNDVGGALAQIFASGPVSGGPNSSVGGLVGENLGGIDQGFATGSVTGGVNAGGFVGHDSGGGTIVAGAFDVLTTGKAVGIGLDDATAPQSGNTAALTTTQLQTGGLPGGFDPMVWGGGANGLYPFLASFFPNGVQAVSGVAYSDAGTTPIPSGGGVAVIVQLLAGGIPVGTAATGANGYYYIAAPAGTITAGELLQASIISGGPAESGFFTPPSNFVAQPGVNIYGAPGQHFIFPTQGSTNLATATTAGMLTGATLVGGVVTPGPVDYVSTGSVATVTLTAARTLIDWTTFEVGNGATVNFDFNNSAGDVVLNRLAAGAITVDAGGMVNGFYGGQPGGNIWFLASNGVLINGAVTAGGVLTTNNTAVADLNLLSDAAATLKGELAATSSLIDFADTASVAGAEIDGSGNILLTGAIDTGPAGAVNLVSTGTITQGGGAIVTGTLTGSSVGGTTLAGTNQIAALGDFANTGGGGFTLADAVPLSIAARATLDAGGGTLTLVDTSSSIAAGAGSVLRAGQDINLSVFGGAAAIGGVITAGRNINIVAATLSDPQGALTAPGALTLSLSDPNGVVLTGSPSTGPGSDIVASTLFSPNVAIYESATGGIAISTVTLPSVVSSFGLFTSGLVDVTGAFLPGAANVALTIGGGQGPATPREIRVQNIVGSGSTGGAIGSPGAPFGLVSLTASGDILLGSPAFDSAAEQIPVTTPGNAVNPLTPSPNPPLTPAIANRTDGAIFLDVVNLSVAAGGRVLQQNTAGLLGPADSGVLIGGDLTLNPYNGAGPQNFDLYAMFVNPTVTGAAAAASNRIILNTPAPAEQSLYRVDGCVIQSANACAASAEAAAAVTPAVDGPMTGKPVPVVAPMQVLPVFLLAQPEAADIADTSVIGATNEEIWRKPDGRKP